MKKNRKNVTLNVFIKSQIIIIILYTVLLTVASVILYNYEELSDKSYFYITSILSAFANFSGGFYAGMKLKQNGLVTALLFSIPTTMIVLLISISINNFHIDLTLLFTAIIMLCGGMLGGITSVNTNVKTKR